MLRLPSRDADVLPEPPLVEAPWRVMTAPQPAPHPTEVLDLRKPGTGEVIRIGPTVTQVAGFGRHAEVARWLAAAFAVPCVVIGADAFDDLDALHRHADHLEPHERQTLVDRVLELAEQARGIEDALDRMAQPVDPEELEARVSAVRALAEEWDAFAVVAAERRPGMASREIELRARTTELLRKLPGPDPVGELQRYAEDLEARRPNPEAAVALRSELDRIEAEGRDLVACIDAADGVALPAVRLDELFGTDTCPVIVDGDLLYAVAPTIHDMLLDKLRSEADRRRVVIVLDDTMLDVWLESVHGSTVWTTGHLHLVPPDPEPARTSDGAEDSRSRRSGKAKVGGAGKALSACAKHPSQLTRLVCTSCNLSFCSACLVRVGTKHTLLCLDCAIARGTGVKRPRR